MCVIPLLCSPDGPSTPFGSPLLVLVDTIRFLTVLGGVIIAAATPAISRAALTEFQRRRLISIGLFALVAATTELEHLGDFPSYRLAINVLAVGYALWGYQLNPQALLSRRDR